MYHRPSLSRRTVLAASLGLCLPRRAYPSSLEIEVYTEKEERRYLSDFTKKGPLLINLWATWCAPCVEEMPLLNELHKTIPVLGLCLIDDDSQIASLKEIKQDYPNMLMYKTERAKLQREVPFSHVPAFIVYNKEGTITHWQQDTIKDDLRRRTLIDAIREVV